MSMVDNCQNQEYLDAIKRLRLIDDAFFNVCMDDNNECMQLILQIILQRDDIIVKNVVTQRTAHNLYGRGVRFDVLAADSTGKLYEIEIQRNDEGALPQRARYNSSLLDSREVAKGTDFDQLPETWVIFITENDIFAKNLPLYHVERTIKELQQDFNDNAHILYANSSYQDNSALGKLMHDFHCSDPAKMHYKPLANRADFFKTTKEGVKTMCKIMEEIQDKGHKRGIEEGRSQMALDTAMDMLRDNEPIEKIVKYSHLPLERIQELAATLH